MRHRTIRRDVERAGSVNALLALWAFVDDQTFVTKAGDVGVVYRLRGQDYEGLDHDQRRHVVHQYEAALRLLDDRTRVYQYLVKRQIPAITAARCASRVVDEAVQARAAHLNARAGALFEIDVYLVLMYEGLAKTTPWAARVARGWRHPQAAWRAWLSPGTVTALLEADLDRAVEHLHHHARALEIHLADTVRPERLAKAEMFQFFRRLVNYDRVICDTASLTYDAHLDFFVADSSVECYRTHLDVGETHVKVLTMREPPSATFAHVLEDLYTIPGELIACLEWQRIANDRMRRELHTRRRHHHNRRVSMINYLSSETRPEEVLVDESEGTIVRQLGDALTEIEVAGHFFGECSLTLVLLSRDMHTLDSAAAEALKVLATHNGSFHVESYNLVNAWTAIVPGNRAFNLRRLAVLETNCADLSFLFTLDQGERTARRPWRTRRARRLRDASSHAVLLQPPCRRRRAHARLRSDRQREKLSSEFPDDPCPEVRPPHSHLRSGAQLPQARGCAGRQLPRTRAAPEQRPDNQSLRALAYARKPAFSARFCPGAPRRCRRLPPIERGGSRALRSHREPLCAEPGATTAVHPGQHVAPSPHASSRPVDR